ncbi:MAG: Short-chain dehydrogenase [Verrucomicrobiales bacterium]|nr:Short-chain dehydrogenase [Verrucomicrobiales bacterium]
MRSDQLAKKSIVIIGGTSGLGFSAARAFINAGARVVIVGREKEKVDNAKKELGENCLGLAADASDPKAAPAAIQVALGNFKGFHGLYHVAGGSGRRKGDGPLHELTDEGWSYTLNQNLTSMFYSNRAAVQQFLAQRSGGSILNMGSVLGLSPSPHFFSTHGYAAAKAATVGLTKSSAAYYAPQSIRFNVVAPGLVATPMSQRAQGDEEIMAFVSTKQPLDGGRIGAPSDLDAAAVYFLSDDSKFVTGQVLCVDGGWTVSDGQIPRRGTAEAPPPKESNLASKLFSLWKKIR